MTTLQAGGGNKHKTTRPAKSIAIWLHDGETELEKGRYEHAVESAQRILQKDSHHLGALELLARAHWRSGNFEEGLDTLRHLIRLNPYEPGYHFMRAGAHQALGHYGEAILAYGRCLNAENASLRQSAAVAIRELESWQESLIAGLLKSDRGFELEYAMDPMEACRRRGFAFVEEASAVTAALPISHEHALVWERPS